MKVIHKNKFTPIIKEIIGDQKRFSSKGNLIFTLECPDILKGVYFESSDFDPNSFYVTWFFLPTFIETDHLYFNFGDRLRNESTDRWSMINSNFLDKIKYKLKIDIFPLFDKVCNINEFIAFLETRNDKCIYCVQAILYSFAYLGKTKEFFKLMQQLSSCVDDKIRWQYEIYKQAEHLSQLVGSDQEKIREMLDENKKTTIKKLGMSI